MGAASDTNPDVASGRGIPAALDGLVALLVPGQRVAVAGLPVSAVAIALQRWTVLHPGHAVVVVGTNPQEAEALADAGAAWGWDVDVLVPGTVGLPAEQSDLEVLGRLRQSEGVRSVATTVDGILAPWPEPDELDRQFLELVPGQSLKQEELTEKLDGAGYQRESQVIEAGQYAVRGGIVDVFSWHAEDPARVEWFGDDIESIRVIDPVSQQSVVGCHAVEILLPEEGESGAKSTTDLLHYFSKEPLVVDLSGGMEALEVDWVIESHEFLEHLERDPVHRENRRERVGDLIAGWVEENWNVVLACNNEGEAQRLQEWLAEAVPVSSILEKCEVVLVPLQRGFVWPQLKWAVLSDAEIFSRYQRSRRRAKRDRMLQWRRAERQFDLYEDGDPVVHMEYGVGIYRGIRTLPAGADQEREVLELEYADACRLYVPLDQSYLVGRYVGSRHATPPLDSLGSSRWSKKTADARAAVVDYAARLIRLQAERGSKPGYAFPPDHEWQREFEAAFLYEPTPDQEQAVAECKADMERDRPMDRLICGDVGFGKTEVAIRIAFKAVMAGKQVAFLAPTTVLAQQHFETLTERMADYPVRLAVLSRFVSPREQNQTIQALREGTVDLVVGTHRLLSPDIEFKDLGLVIIDEEQRFGVDQKEELKERYRMVDMLSLSATPIPRTLYFALMGTRDMSTIDTPPPNRRPVETTVATYDERLIRSAIERELNRGGQVFFLHNRVKTIQRVAKQIQFLLPQARVDIGHGQMPEHQLEDVMHRFLEQETDVLVSTTIIESGIDIPNANTIIIDRADRFGLADLYQLRGRVGRSSTKAHALLLVPRDLIRGDAGKRVRAIRRYSELGSGFKVAMRDLEIRGAGNLLGKEQSGHIAAIGFELYCRLLKQAVRSVQGGKSTALGETKVYFDFLAIGERDGDQEAVASLTSGYMPETRWRIEGYRQLAEVESESQLDALGSQWRDRFGPLPLPVQRLIEYQRIRVMSLAGHITQIDVKDDKLMIQQRGDYVMINGKFPRLRERETDARLQEIQGWIKSLL